MLQIIYNIIILIEKYTEHSANGSESVHLQGKWTNQTVHL